MEKPLSNASRKSMTVAMYQGPCELGDVQRNLDNMKQQMASAKAMGADVIAFPELFTCGYMLSNDRMRELAERKDGKSFMELSHSARNIDIGVLYGYCELDETNGHIYDSAQFIDKSGVSLSNYRKTHLWLSSTDVERVFTPGIDFTEPFEFCGMKVGLLICYDLDFCEAVRIVALRGAEIIMVPTACSDKYCLNFLSASRAYENGIYVVYVNHCGDGFSGKSVCCCPEGKIVAHAEAKKEGIFLATLPQVTPRLPPHLDDRRPELYNELVAKNVIS